MGRRKRISKQEKSEVANGASTFSPGNDETVSQPNKEKDDQISQMDEVDEIAKLRELNQELLKQITSLRKEMACSFSDKTNLEATVLKLKDENIEIESELTESKARNRGLLEKNEDDRHLWDSERRKLEGIVAELQSQLDLTSREKGLLSQKNTKLSTEAESLNAQINVLKSELNESKGRTGELLGKIEEGQHLWDEEKRTMENSLAELQTNNKSMDRERRSLSQKNGELSTEMEFLKVRVNEYNEKVICMEANRQLLKEMLSSEAERLQDLLTKNATMEDKINQLEQQNKMLQDEADSTRCLLENKDQKILQSNIEKAKLDKKVQELSKKLEEIYDTHINQVKEKEEQRIEYESLVAKKHRELEARHLELLREIEEQGKMIESLQRENSSLESERSLLLRSIDEASKSCEEISEKCLKSDQRVLELESQSLRLHTELAAAKLACDETTIQLNKIKEDMNKLSISSCQIQEELLSPESSLEEMKLSASKGEQQKYNIQSQFLAIAEEKDGHIFDTHRQLLSMEEELSNHLGDLQDRFSLAWAKSLLEEENASLEIDLDGTLVSEKEEVNPKGRGCKLETEETESQLVDLQYQPSDLEEAKTGPKEKNNSLFTEVKSKLKPLPVKSPVIQNGKQKGADEKPKPNTIHQTGKQRVVHEKPKTKSEHEVGNPNRVIEKSTPKLSKGVHENGKPNRLIEKSTPKLLVESETPKPKDVDEKPQPRSVPESRKQIGVLETRTPKQPAKWMPNKLTPNRMPEKKTPKWVP